MRLPRRVSGWMVLGGLIVFGAPEVRGQFVPSGYVYVVSQPGYAVAPAQVVQLVPVASSAPARPAPANVATAAPANAGQVTRAGFYPAPPPPAANPAQDKPTATPDQAKAPGEDTPPPDPQAEPQPGDESRLDAPMVEELTKQVKEKDDELKSSEPNVIRRRRGIVRDLLPRVAKFLKVQDLDPKNMSMSQRDQFEDLVDQVLEADAPAPGTNQDVGARPTTTQAGQQIQVIVPNVTQTFAPVQPLVSPAVPVYLVPRHKHHLRMSW